MKKGLSMGVVSCQLRYRIFKGCKYSKHGKYNGKNIKLMVWHIM